MRLRDMDCLAVRLFKEDGTWGDFALGERRKGSGRRRCGSGGKKPVRGSDQRSPDPPPRMFAWRQVPKGGGQRRRHTESASSLDFVSEGLNPGLGVAVQCLKAEELGALKQFFVGEIG